MKSIYQQELTPDLVKRTLAKAAPLAREAYERTGRFPDTAAFTEDYDPNAEPGATAEAPAEAAAPGGQGEQA